MVTTGKMIAYRIKVEGIVQGVGFRPFVYRLALELGLTGIVYNIGAAVIIEVEGRDEQLQEFVSRLSAEAPVLSDIKRVVLSEQPVLPYPDFQIRESHSDSGAAIFIAPDVSICRDCCRELYDPENPRYLYPFINCTNCGPRFTIIKGLPYDRVHTTMDSFTMCPNCHKEYTDAKDRRYHAQPISCYQCGPSLVLLDSNGEPVAGGNKVNIARALLAEGKIIALKGIGGYHLVCDARNGAAVERLRCRKQRDRKPFAIMAKNEEVAASLCHLSPMEQELLLSPKRPIVLLRRRKETDLPAEIAPGNPYLGVMLPYTPLHLLLFNSGRQDEFSLDVLVVTSGNRSELPIFYKDSEALSGLKDIADFFLTHDREIFIRADDSVTRVFREKEYVIRRSRGYVPLPLQCEVAGGLTSSEESVPQVLACGGQMKNTFCINRGDQFYLSQYIGDLDDWETFQSYQESIRHFQRMLESQPRVVAHDLHPDYLSTRYALEQEISSKIGVQHHQAHIASCMAENNLEEPVLGVAFDGTGYGEDGHIWGGEFFAGSYSSFLRKGHLEYLPMPGGEAAIREPWRMALGLLTGAGVEWEPAEEQSGVKVGVHTLFEDIGREQLVMVKTMLAKGLNTPLTSSAGRLFDAVSALLGIVRKASFEGEAAIALEYEAESQRDTGRYHFDFQSSGDCFCVSFRAMIREILCDLADAVPLGVIGARFHRTLAIVIGEACRRMREQTGLNKVVLSGGVFQNMLLLELTVSQLESGGFQVFTHSKVPANDGGIALGQAMIALARIQDKGRTDD